MPSMTLKPSPARLATAWRIGCTAALIIVVEVLVCAVAALPAAAALAVLVQLTAGSFWARVAALSAAAVPAYVCFALALMPVSAGAARLTGARTPENLEMVIADMGWPLMRWVRFMVSLHIVRLFAGHLFRGSPIWTVYLRMSGARLGRRVYVNSLALSDYNLLQFGDDVVVGADAHVAGHTVEQGIVKTGPVMLHDGVTIGVGCVIEIDVEIGEGSQVGALSFVAKHARLEARTIYAGIPVKRLHAA
jgi:acetyltransferase-like isoleucine patch superfamily enzyme